MADILDFCEGREAKTFKPGDVLIKEGGQDGKLFILTSANTFSAAISTAMRSP